ncbi:MAG: hypothetical protein ucyna2_00003 [Candidatus Atelocyanobacterium thalassa isolate SIO64986]|uniref:Uncharacterized protein n=1 Tax=Candidatus Atelocyanobacterium thalassa isolate SIO64986 TaxID=1527444 RepID=A0A086CID3_9CHRO|nr:MAG: hypothetical protein ucyna2_00003 [Candidatus Atelocyanobacterium thalassa isolate SIO64986]
MFTLYLLKYHPEIILKGLLFSQYKNSFSLYGQFYFFENMII